MSRYNLIDEKWIPVRDLTGDRKELGILEVLTNAESLAAIEDPSPLVTAALHRFLLAVLYRALEGPCDIDEARILFKNGLPKEKIRAYLEKWRERFWLFDEKYPFGQIPKYEPTMKDGKQKWRAWTVLAAEHNADNAKVLFDHIDISNAGALQAKKTLKWLLSCQTFALGGGNSDFKYVKDAPSASSVMVIPVGNNLFSTLLFCLVPQNREIMIQDLPIWERDIESLEQLRNGIDRVANGYADLYTWRSRSIRLQENNESEIHKMAFASGIGFLDSALSDPMVGQRINETLGRLPMQFRERGFWRDFDSILPDGTDLPPATIVNAVSLTRKDRNQYPRSVIVLGQANNKAKIEFWRTERFVLPEAIVGDKYIREDIRAYLQSAEDVNKILYTACATYAKLLLSRGDRIVDKNDTKSFIEQMPTISNYWSVLESKFHEVLRSNTIGKKPEEIHHDWLVAVRNALFDSWKLHLRSIAGSDAWAIRALVKAEDIIAKKVNELNKTIQTLKEVS
jgi:CRISPR system Cascade subunit CasA